MIESGTVTRSWQRQAFEPLEDEEESSALQQQFRKTLSQPDPPAPDYTLTVLQNLAMATSSEPPPQGSDSWMAAATAEPPETPAAIGTELPLPRSQSDAEAASNGAASDAGDRSADWAFIQRHDAYAARMDEFRAEYSALSSFRGGVGQGFLDYANEMTLANLREPQWADEEFASIESQGWSLPEAAAKAAAGSSGQPRSSAQPAVNWAEADRADAAGSVDLRTASGHFVPDTQHDAVLAGINAERGINPHGTTPRGEEASPQFAEASSSGPTYGEFGEEIPPAQQIVIVGQRPPAYADTIAERIGGTLGALYNLGNALGESIRDEMMSPGAQQETAKAPPLPDPIDPASPVGAITLSNLPSTPFGGGPLYAANDVVDPLMPQTMTDAGPGSSDDVLPEADPSDIARESAKFGRQAANASAANALSRANLIEMPAWQIQGAGDKGLASAMTVLQGERNAETGAWGINASEEQINQHLQTIADARGVPLEQIQADFDRFQELAAKRDSAAMQNEGFRPGPFDEGSDGETRVPLLSMSKSNGLPDNSAHMASIEQLRFGKLVGDALGVDPAFGALLSPTGGIAGAGNKEVGGFAYALGGGKEIVVTHGIAHDAGGYLLNYHDVGPGYQYIPDVSFHMLDRTNPLAGQVDGLRFFFNLKNYGSPEAPPNLNGGP